MMKAIKRQFSMILIVLSLVTTVGVAYGQKAHADYYSPWLAISVSGVKQKKILYNGTKTLIQLYQEVRYRRTYVDKGGRTKYQYKTEIRNLGLKSPYAP
ncbi:hypothetical protein [Streptococcus hyointestinalis]|uniref:hypothetical protein n=1 Tax=Streptococcus hyointestinalis TaxID=1337 RepID=UPI0013DEF743|nr:hypothetical protein [Streptococcus hyointestinalis]